MQACLQMGANRKTIERPRQGAVSRLGSAPAGAHKMGAANLVAPMLAHSPANPHSRISRTPQEQACLQMGASRKTIERPRQGAVSRLGSAPAGANKMHEVNLVAPLLAYTPR